MPGARNGMENKYAYDSTNRELEKCEMDEIDRKSDLINPHRRPYK